MPDGVDTVMNPVQPAGRDAPRNGLVREPEPLFQLSNRHYPVLPYRQPGQALFALPPLRSTYGPAGRARSSLGPVPGRQVDRTGGPGP